ncbi:hypothetical protein M514_07749 [Trichuris suis]|uniref:Helix-turn-helix domain-containing protein n=1 Tax=Trichuris suis TaxID=68888 RepID=A0A085M298_9BILA|nr:hypothetical protein M513_07749 [Trichuris suis]KFD59862.1 hypothetical protein M514_07749 [Trichuris suis]
MIEGNFFHFQGHFFEQKGGASMGSPLSPVLAEVFMEHLEDKAFSEADRNILPRLFKRYVDDIFVIIESGREDIFLNFLNGLFPNTISFAMEKEVSGKLPFLDSLVIRMPERLKTNVYRKPTHSDRYIHFSPHHPRAVMKGVIQGMARRAIDLCEPEFLEAELNHIFETFKENGYPSSLVHSAIQQTLANPENSHFRPKNLTLLLQRTKWEGPKATEGSRNTEELPTLTAKKEKNETSPSSKKQDFKTPRHYEKPKRRKTRRHHR